MTQEEFDREYRRLGHAMQTGVAFELEHGSASGDPKHLRVGVNNAMRDHASLGHLLVKKGLITLEEYYDAIIEGQKDEVEDYENRISKKMGRLVSLG